MKTILSLFDYTGTWSYPYKRNGYDVIQVDLQHGDDVFEVMEDVIMQTVDHGSVHVHGVLAAPPCTDFSGSGARHWKGKEFQAANYESERTQLQFDNTTELSLGLVFATMEIISLLNPRFYAIENPVGRLRRLVPELGEPWYFQPSDYGDPYTKKTGLWGKFNRPVKTPVLPLFGSEMWSKYGGISLKTKQARSKTPEGFANAFFLANQ